MEKADENNKKILHEGGNITDRNKRRPNMMNDLFLGGGEGGGLLEFGPFWCVGH